MISNLFNAMFGCWHMHCSVPITVRAVSHPGRRNRMGALVARKVA